MDGDTDEGTGAVSFAASTSGNPNWLVQVLAALFLCSELGFLMSQASSNMRNPIRIYRRLLHERPFITNVLTSATFMSVGDLISQSILQDKHKIDWHQTARFGFAGLIFVGPVVRGCLVAIDRMFGPTSGFLVLGKKVLFDQGVIAPCFIAANISVLTFIKERSLEEIRRELKNSYLGILKLNYTFWPFVSLANFYFIPLTYRVVFGSSAALMWNTIFSYKLSCTKLKTNDQDSDNVS